MKKLLLLALSISAASCATTYSARSIYREINVSEARIQEPNLNKCEVIPMAVGLNVSETRITYTVEYDWVRQIKTEEYKVRAIAEASIKNKCDLIMGVLTQINSIDKGKKLRITVTGYPASYSGFRPASEADMIMIKTSQGKLIIKEETKKSCCEK